MSLRIAGVLGGYSWFHRRQVHTVVQERLSSRREKEIAAVHRHVGVDPGWRDERHERRSHVGGPRTEVPPGLRAAFDDRVHDDVERLRELVGDELAEWGP